MDPTSALRASNDAVTLFAALMERKANGVRDEEIRQQWSSFVLTIGDCAVRAPDGDLDSSLQQLIGTLSRLLADDSGAASPMGSRGRLRGLPRRVSGHDMRPASAEKKTLREEARAPSPGVPRAPKAPTQSGLDGGLTDEECSGFRIE